MCGCPLLGSQVHAKTCTIDGIWSDDWHSANLDRLSLQGNYEVNVAITDSTVAQRMAEIFEIDMANCVELTFRRMQSRSHMLETH